MDSAVQDITDFAVSVLDQIDAPVFPAGVVLAMLRSAVDSDTAAFQRTDWRSGATDAVIDGFVPDDLPVLKSVVLSRRFEHPLMVATARGDLRAATVSERAGGAAAGGRPGPLRRDPAGGGGGKK